MVPQVQNHREFKYDYLQSRMSVWTSGPQENGTTQMIQCLILLSRLCLWLVAYDRQAPPWMNCRRVSCVVTWTMDSQSCLCFCKAPWPSPTCRPGVYVNPMCRWAPMSQDLCRRIWPSYRWHCLCCRQMHCATPSCTALVPNIPIWTM